MYVFFIFQQKVEGYWKANNKKWKKFHFEDDYLLLEYALGCVPEHIIGWSKLDILYVPINIKKSHWMLGVVHLHARKIYIYDSFTEIIGPAKLKAIVTPLARVMPQILKAVHYYEEGYPNDMQEWGVQRVENLPQQTNR